MKKYKRIFTVVIDSLGIGAMSDSEKFGDKGVDTLGHIAESVETFNIPNLQKLGMANLHPLKNVKPVEKPLGYFMPMNEASFGKDTMTGHWELMGLNIQTPFRVFPEGFPKELLDKISEFSGRNIVCNLPYSGTKVIDDYGKHQMETGDLIVYTSADPVLQIAAHEDIIPLEELYRICEYTREITKDDPYMIGRIIARPYVGEPGAFVRTSNRHDYALDPFGKTTLDFLKEDGKDVIAIGKINDIFNGQGITSFVRTANNMDGVDKFVEVLKQDFTGMSFTNLVDFDALFGHRRNVEGYRDALQEFDARIPEIVENMKEDDLLIITADHGNDPTFPGTDHTREYIPVLAISPKFEGNGQFTQGHFSDIGAMICENFGVQSTGNGVSFLDELK